MLRRYVRFIVLTLIVLVLIGLASVGVVIFRAMTTNPGVCAEVLVALDRPTYPAGKTGNLCDFHVQSSDGLQAYIRRIEAAQNWCGLSAPFEFMSSLKADYVEAVQARIEACDAAARDPHGEGSARVVVSLALADFSSGPCKALVAAALENAPPDRAWDTFEAHHTNRNYCDFLVEHLNSEQAIIDRFEPVKAECTVPDWLKARHARTLEMRTKICDAATVDPDGLVISYAR